MEGEGRGEMDLSRGVSNISRGCALRKTNKIPYVIFSDDGFSCPKLH